MKNFTFDVPAELCDALEAKQYEVNGLQKLIAFALSMNNEYQVADDKFARLQKEFIKANAEYELLKEKVEDLFGDIDKTRASWNLDFRTKKVVVTIDE